MTKTFRDYLLLFEHEYFFPHIKRKLPDEFHVRKQILSVTNSIHFNWMLNFCYIFHNYKFSFSMVVSIYYILYCTITALYNLFLCIDRFILHLTNAPTKMNFFVCFEYLEWILFESDFKIQFSTRLN